MPNKTYNQLLDDIGETARKWRKTMPVIENVLPPRSRTKRYQSADEREVKMRWMAFFKPIALTVRRKETATENLSLLATALETMRLAEVRGVTDLLVALYRQTHPALVQQAPEPPKQAQVSWEHATLCIAPNAPLAVAEAAYKALTRTAHPDAGGSHDAMVKLNQAIESLRKKANV